LAVTRLHCPSCGTTLEGDFSVGRFGRLNREQLTLLESFLRSRGNLRDMERVYAELGWSDSLVAPLDTLIAASPREETYRTVQLRTLQSLGREAELRRAVDAWVHDLPNSVSPYREYARLLLQKNRAVAADSVLARAKLMLGTTKDLQLEIAQARAAQGQWISRREPGDRPCSRLTISSKPRRTSHPLRRRRDSRYERSFSRRRSKCHRVARWLIWTTWGSPTDGMR
jgi:hypothetical protein